MYEPIAASDGRVDAHDLMPAPAPSYVSNVYLQQPAHTSDSNEQLPSTSLPPMASLPPQIPEAPTPMRSRSELEVSPSLLSSMLHSAPEIELLPNSLPSADPSAQPPLSKPAVSRSEPLGEVTVLKSIETREQLRTSLRINAIPVPQSDIPTKLSTENVQHMDVVPEQVAKQVIEAGSHDAKVPRIELTGETLPVVHPQIPQVHSPMPSKDTIELQPTITVSIGRIEIRGGSDSNNALAAAAPQKRESRVMSLEQYLSLRSQGTLS